MEKELLEVGDVLYRNASFGYGINKYKVIRVTNTQAILDPNKKVTRQLQGRQDDRYARVIGGASYEPSTYRIETPELKAKFEHQQLKIHTNTLLDELKSKLGTLSTEQLSSLNNYLSSLNNNQTS